MNRLELLHDESVDIALRDEEKNQLRESLLAYMDKVPVVSPYAEPLAFHKQKRNPWIFALATILAFVVCGTGVSFAASRALPGDALYPVKVGFNEKVKSFFAVGDKNKAEVEASIASERLAEAEKLNAKAELNDETKATLQNNFAAHVSAYESHVAVLKQHNDASDATKVDADFQASLSAHAAILPTLNSALVTAAATTTNQANTNTDSSVTTTNNTTVNVNNVASTTTSLVKNLVSTPKANAEASSSINTEVNTVVHNVLQ